MKIVEDLSLSDYLANSAIGNSDLTNLAECPAAFKYYKDNPGDNGESTPDQIEGSSLHKILELGELPSQISRDDKRKTIAEEKEENILLGWERYDRVSVMAWNILHHPDIKKLLRKGKYETSVFTKLEDVDVKSRPDFMPDGIPIIVDFKTTRYKLTERNLSNECVRWRYFVQAPYYLDQQPERQAFVFVFVSKVAPYLAGIYEPDEAMLEFGRRDYIKQLELYKRCLEKDEWPGYLGIRPLSLPKCILREDGYGE